MHEHDLDLIAALADGSASDSAGARSLIETCPVCRAEYEAQTRVLAWLAAEPAPEMTDLERAGLHRGVRSAIESARPQAVPAPWWQRLGYVAAGLLVAAGLFGVLQNAGLMEVGDETAASETTFAAEGAGAPAEEVPFVAEDAGEGLDTLSAPSTTATAAESLTLPFAQFADEARASQVERDASAMDDEDRECLTQAGLDRHVVVREIEEGGRAYLVVMAEEPTEESVVVFVELPDCRVVFEDR